MADGQTNNTPIDTIDEETANDALSSLPPPYTPLAIIPSREEIVERQSKKVSNKALT